MIVDTNALSAFAEGQQRVREIIAQSVGPFLLVIVLGEYRFGLLSSRERARRQAWLSELVRHWPVLDITSETTTHYADIQHALRAQATPIPGNDVWIGALALQHAMPVLSNDLHFDHIPGLQRVVF